MTRSDRDSANKVLKRKRHGMEHDGMDCSLPTLTEVTQKLCSLQDALEEDVELEGLVAVRSILVYLGENCKQDSVSSVLLENNKWLPVLLKWLNIKRYPIEGCPKMLSVVEDVLKETCFIISQLATVPDFRNGGVDARSILERIFAILCRVPLGCPIGSKPTWGGLARRACECVTNISHENETVKRLIHDLDGIAPLIRLLSSQDPKVQRAAAAVLRTLAFKEDVNKMSIVKGNALPALIEMLRSEDHLTHYEAVGTLGNLVHSSQEIKKEVLNQGALQPVINLLKCSCRDSQREAALLVGQFAQHDNNRQPRRDRDRARANGDNEDYRVKIVQRGAVPPLIAMLKASDRPLKEMAAFALGRLAQTNDNQAGIFAMGALAPLLELLHSKAKNLEHNAAFALYGLTDNADNAPEIVKQGGYEQLRTSVLPEGQATKDCISKTLKRLAEKLNGNAAAKEHLMILLRSPTPGMKERIATALAHLLLKEDLAHAYLFYGGLTVLLDSACGGALDSRLPNALAEGSAEEAAFLKAQGLAVEALEKLTAQCRSAESSSNSYIPLEPEKQVFIGSSYVNNPHVHDVVFSVAGRPFYAHKLALSASSEAFNAMFTSDCREGHGGIPTIEIPYIRWEVFNAMMMYIYTGDIGGAADIEFERELMQAADQYLLDKLKRSCEENIANRLDATSVLGAFELAEQYNAKFLAQRAAVLVVTHYKELLGGSMGVAGYVALLRTVRPRLNEYITEYLAAEPPVADAADADAAAVASADDVQMIA